MSDSDLVAMWEAHRGDEFVLRDVAAAMAMMIAKPRKILDSTLPSSTLIPSWATSEGELD